MSCRVKTLCVLAALACLVRITAAQEMPAEPVKPPGHSKVRHGMAGAALQIVPRQPPAPLLNPPRVEHHAARTAGAVAIPEQLAPPQEVYASQPEKAAATPTSTSDCRMRLANIAEFRPLPPLIGAGECGAPDPVLLEAVILPDQAKVPLSPPATLRCTMAEQIAHFIREDVAPAALKLGAPLRGVDNYDSYECRGRNRVRGARLSEHGRANALDVRSFRLADERTIGLTDVTVPKTWREAIRARACARFSTVLGPGSDGEHEEHIHLDLAERRGGYKICEWDVRGPMAEAENIVPQAQTELADEDGSASIPPELVPLPRPRPRTVDAAGDRAGRH